MVNAFVTEINPYKCAESHSDFMLDRMALETAEVLSGNRWNQVIGWDEDSKDYPKDTDLYPPYYRSSAQRRHPLVLWCQKDRLNFHWLYHYGVGLIQERKRRFPDKVPLKCARVYRWFVNNDDRSLWDEECFSSYKELTFNVAINEEYQSIMNQLFKKQKGQENPILSNDILHVYRFYFLYKYLYVYTRNHEWTNTVPPAWMTFGDLRMEITRTYGEPTTKTSLHALQFDPPF